MLPKTGQLEQENQRTKSLESDIEALRNLETALRAQLSDSEAKLTEKAAQSDSLCQEFNNE